MKAALLALVLLGGILVGYSASASVSIDGTADVSCDATGSVGVDDADPTAPTTDVGAPACTGLG